MSLFSHSRCFQPLIHSFFVTSSSFLGGERKHSHFPKLKSEKVKILTSPSIFADIGTKINIMENILHAFSLDIIRTALIKGIQRQRSVSWISTRHVLHVRWTLHFRSVVKKLNWSSGLDTSCKKNPLLLFVQRVELLLVGRTMVQKTDKEDNTLLLANESQVVVEVGWAETSEATDLLQEVRSRDYIEVGAWAVKQFNFLVAGQNGSGKVSHSTLLVMLVSCFGIGLLCM